jgi:glycosyltransferase involved in cell wall biosynthesis
VRIAYVVPRYGTEVLGGAEYGARMLAERLVSFLAWDVEVLTTCALDARTWADEYPEGTVDVNGVRVHRFRSAAGRHPDFDALSGPVLRHPEATSLADAERWIDLQGPVNPAIVEAVGDSDADLVVFYPYLYHPTVRGVPVAGRRAVMHPAAHDEPPLRLPVFGPVFRGVRGLVYQTYGERDLVERLFSVAHVHHVVMGLGVEEQEGDSAAAVPDAPFLLCLGRVDDGKGAGMLARWFAEYKARRPGPLQLVFAGPVVHPPPEHPDIRVLGPVTEEAKWGLLRRALALVNPSYFEAFSIVLMEAWTAGVPVVVNGACLATREHCERSGGGLWFTHYAEFEVVVDRLQADEGLRAGLAERGRGYVDAHFRWPVIIERYRRFLECLGEP